METQLWQPNRTEIIHDLENNFNKNKILQLKSLFPEAFCEEQIDWEKLKLILGADNLAHQNERYQLNWAGKTDAYRTLQAPTFNSLSPCRAESVDFDGTRNLFIEAENLEALKILQKAYAGSVKMIYIDPPYNTGSDSFIYPDKFSETREEYARRVGDKDADGYLKRDGVFQGAWRKNPRENGHYHSNWLSMMLPRLHLARTLLRDDGVIFISIDDNEQAQLKLLCDEVFGAENFVGCAGRITKKSNNKGDFWAPNFDYLLTYTKNIELAEEFFGGINIDSYNLIEESGDRKGERYQLVRLYMSTIQNRNPEQRFWIECPDGTKVIPPGNTFPPERPLLGDGIWRWTRKKFEEEKDRIVIKRVRSSNLITEDGSKAQWNVFTKTYLQDVIDNSIAKPNSFIEDHINQKGSHELKRLNIPFDYSKPSSLITYLLEICKTKKDDLILDFFSGSGTTAHAVMQLNAEDGGNRRYICVQLPEETDEKSEARKAGFDTIAEIAKERIRRAGTAVSGSLKDGQSVDTGFKVFKLSESSFKQWRQPENGADLEKQLRLAIDSVNETATPENMVYELMLRLGCKLTSAVEHKNGVYWVTDEDTGKRIALLLEAADQTLIDEVIAAAPAKVVALDKWFDGNDALKSNTVLQMKDAGIVIECV